MSIVVLCPTRGRPQAMRDAAASLVRTRVLGSTQIVAILDTDDPEADNYTSQSDGLYDWVFPTHAGGMVAALNAGAVMVMEQHPEAKILGFIGDDHRFRTDGWDNRITAALAKPGYAYGHDGAWQDGAVPTQIFISRQIVEALGYYALPDCHHLYVDNAWRAVAEAIGRFTWLKDVLIEHMHPAFGKAEWDEGHQRVNAPEMYGRDGAAFEAWRASPRFSEDVKRARRALGPATISTR